jgi:hypothetical protein
MPRLLDRKPRKVVTHRIACGRPGRPPTKLDFLEVTGTEQKSQDGPYEVDWRAMWALAAPEFSGRYIPPRADGKPIEQGDLKPRRIPVRCPSDRIDEFLEQEYQSRRPLRVKGPDGSWAKDKAGGDVRRPGVWCRGDGKTASRLGGMGTWQVIPCNSSPSHPERPHADVLSILRGAEHSPFDGSRCPFAQNRDARLGPTCLPTSELYVHCDVVANIGGLCRVRSHGHRSADALRQSLEEIQARMPGGILRMVPLDLVLQLERMQNPLGSGSSLQPVLHLELRLSYEDTMRVMEANLRAQMSLGSAAIETRKLLEAAREERTSDDEIEAEWPSTKTPLLPDVEGNNIAEVE